MAKAKKRVAARKKSLKLGKARAKKAAKRAAPKKAKSKVRRAAKSVTKPPAKKKRQLEAMEPKAPQAIETPVETTIVDVIEEPVPGVVVVTEYESVRVTTPQPN